MEEWRIKLREKFLSKDSPPLESVPVKEHKEVRKPGTFAWGKSNKPVFESQTKGPNRYAWKSKTTGEKAPRTEIQEVIEESKVAEKTKEIVKENMAAVKVIKGQHKVL